MAENKEQWKDFFNAEKGLFEFLRRFCDCLHSIGVNNETAPHLSYAEYVTPAGVTLERPPRFIHWIGRLRSSEDELTYAELAKHVLDMYRKAVGKKFTHYPVRFPEFYKSVDQINISSSSAYSSKSLDANDVVRLKTLQYINTNQRTNAIRLLNDDIKILNGAGYPGAYVANVTDLRAVAVALEIPAQIIIKKAGGGKIQMREYTGQQYRALVRKSGETKGLRKKLGLMVLSNDSIADIFFSAPQAPRKHSYESCGTSVDLQIHTDVKLWVK
ncbi:MAG: hypothetical protein EOO52_13625 [Gammaproteobacteria bacterium]|nr:MAG: hypothetical protein EOO52_13625 [Gammaproteobacteria bacterium]